MLHDFHIIVYILGEAAQGSLFSQQQSSSVSPQQMCESLTAVQSKYNANCIITCLGGDSMRCTIVLNHISKVTLTSLSEDNHIDEDARYCAE